MSNHIGYKWNSDDYWTEIIECFSATSTTYPLSYIFNPPYNGTIKGVRLIHNSGGITCRLSSVTNWGGVNCGNRTASHNHSNRLSFHSRTTTNTLRVTSTVTTEVRTGMASRDPTFPTPTPTVIGEFKEHETEAKFF